jgi:16S rRNA (guanine527-N7)-methyltransferase
VLRVLDPPWRRSLLDVGSGAGLPGIPLKIADPSLDVTLMDSTGKKARFCQEAITALGLAGIRAIAGRAEELAHWTEHRERYQAVVARAVAPLPTLVEYLLPFCAPGGVCVAMKGAAGDDEAAQSARAVALLGGELIRVERLRLPVVEHQRALVVIRKVRRSPAAYPRQRGLPRSRPIQ